MTVVERHKYRKMPNEPMLFRCPNCGDVIRLSDRITSALTPTKEYIPIDKNEMCSEKTGGEWRCRK